MKYTYRKSSLVYATLLICGLIFIQCNDSGDLNEPSTEDFFPEKLYSLDGNGRIVDTEMMPTDFLPSDSCMSCHPNHYNEWNESMHAYAMKDPVFFGGWNGEQLSRPGTGERFCLQCHNPVAFVTGVFLDQYGDSESLQNSNENHVIKEGIGCDVCHTMTKLSTAVVTGDDVSANAEYHYNPGEGIEYGSIENPVANSFHESQYAPIYQRSEICLPCHDFFIRGVEAEITYTEWNRIPAAAMSGGMTCQDCHMVKYPDGHSDHRFTGVDLDLSSPVENTAAYQAVSELLSGALNISPGYPDVDFPASVGSGETLVIPFTITSLTGHALPSGVTFAREAWMEFTISQNGILLFESGLISNDSAGLDENDDQLLLFYSQLLDAQGNHISGVTDAHGIINSTLPGFGARYKSYSFDVPPDITGTLTVSARMLFRSFKPSILEGSHQNLLDNLPVFEMASYQATINIID
ncbi:MAG: hypothetical protein HN729_03945 [Candidatus Marinimicrobia bacterium]|jgi:hypothetical protein|nr:hypothetical protein [Candidatus Neomarinimicrobiota bacterium]MBT3635175.1 hypothetical protein [Candidatus Neomarinimicrobiota bacterium]MBT3683934.1 hypothetical protein [Candidatus Neomarinimicrobiota bacterium]MBT3760860.1 hypothetical protein [Candidatus Neomarinimicrobiota bacterium]MBT3896904.1 hypothetical protein [Candidatus Neomarinimicrobiota bacterium]